MISGRQYRSSASKQATEDTTGSCRSEQAKEARRSEQANEARREPRRQLGRPTMFAAELETAGSMSGYTGSAFGSS